MSNSTKIYLESVLGLALIKADVCAPNLFFQMYAVDICVFYTKSNGF